MMTDDGVSIGTASTMESAGTTVFALRLCPSASRGFALVISYYTIAACPAGARRRAPTRVRAKVAPKRASEPGSIHLVR